MAVHGSLERVSVVRDELTVLRQSARIFPPAAARCGAPVRGKDFTLLRLLNRLIDPTSGKSLA